MGCLFPFLLCCLSSQGRKGRVGAGSAFLAMNSAAWECWDTGRCRWQTHASSSPHSLTVQTSQPVATRPAPESSPSIRPGLTPGPATVPKARFQSCPGTLPQLSELQMCPPCCLPWRGHRQGTDPVALQVLGWGSDGARLGISSLAQLGPLALGSKDGRAKRTGRMRALGGGSLHPPLRVLLPASAWVERRGCWFCVGQLASLTSLFKPWPHHQKAHSGGSGFRQLRDMLSGFILLTVTQWLCDLGPRFLPS